MTSLTFTVAGEAQPKGSTRTLPNHVAMAAFRRGRPLMLRSPRELIGHVLVTSDNPDVKAWQAAIKKAAWCAVQDLPRADRALFVGAVAIRVDFYLPRPSGLAKKYTGPHVKKPDLDKLVRACKDALTDTAWTDDSQVTSVTATKGYAAVGDPPRAVITLTAIEAPLLAAAMERTPDGVSVV